MGINIRKNIARSNRICHGLTQKGFADLKKTVIRPILCEVFLSANLSMVVCSRSMADPCQFHKSFTHPLCIPVSYHIWNCGLYPWGIRGSVSGPYQSVCNSMLLLLYIPIGCNLCTAGFFCHLHTSGLYSWFSFLAFETFQEVLDKLEEKKVDAVLLDPYYALYFSNELDNR